MFSPASFVTTRKDGLTNFASVGSLGTATSTSAGTTLALTLGANAEAGNLVVILVGLDNTGTTDANDDEIASVTDSAGGNTWVNLMGGYRNGNGSANAGICVGIWASVLTNQINSGGTITITFDNSITSKAATVWEFTVSTAEGTLAALPSSRWVSRVDDAADPGQSLQVDPGIIQEYLYIRAEANEDRNAGWTPSSGATAFTSAYADTGSAATSADILGEFIIKVDSEELSNPSLPTGSTSDSASVYLAL